MEIRYYIDPDTGEPHIYEHDVSETEVEFVLMSEQKFPPGWDSERVERLLSHYEDLSENGQVAEDEDAAAEQAGQAVITVPDDLLPAIRQLLASHTTN